MAHEPTKPDFFLAAKKGDSAALISFLDNGADPNAKDPTGATALHYAAFDGRSDTLSLLIRRGANVNARVEPIPSKDGRRINWSVIQWAIENSQLVCVQMLLEAGAEIESADENGETALTHALDPELDPDIARLVLEYRNNDVDEKITKATQDE